MTTTARHRSVTAVILSNVSKSYRPRPSSPSTERSCIIENLSLKITKGSSLALTGASGSGKTTLLNLMGTLSPPDSGTITIDEANTAELLGESLARFRNSRIGFVFQEHRLLPQCDVTENILLPSLAFLRVSPLEQRLRAEELLKMVGLFEAHNAFPDELSGGEKQRVALARALINNPTLLLADEPTGSLDAANASGLIRIMFDLNRSTGLTLVIATHSIPLANEADSTLDLGKS